jgi:hypothetical protein
LKLGGEGFTKSHAESIYSSIYVSVLVKRARAKKKTSANFSSKIIREIFNFLFSLVKKFAFF